MYPASTCSYSSSLSSSDPSTFEGVGPNGERIVDPCVSDGGSGRCGALPPIEASATRESRSTQLPAAATPTGPMRAPPPNVASFARLAAWSAPRSVALAFVAIPPAGRGRKPLCLGESPQLTPRFGGLACAEEAGTPDDPRGEVSSTATCGSLPERLCDMQTGMSHRGLGLGLS